MPAGLPWVILRNSAEDDFKYTLAKERAPRGELRKQVRATELKDLQDLLVENFFVELEVAESERNREDR
jgi:hypothetical protein